MWCDCDELKHISFLFYWNLRADLKLIFKHKKFFIKSIYRLGIAIIGINFFSIAIFSKMMLLINRVLVQFGDMLVDIWDFIHVSSLIVHL